MVAYKFNAVVLSALVVAAQVNSAYALVLRAGTPACATSCEQTAGNIIQCNGPSDLDCVCNTLQFYQFYDGCIYSQCDPTDYQAAQNGANELCASHASTGLLNSLTINFPTGGAPTNPVPATLTNTAAVTTPTDSGASTPLPTGTNTAANTNSGKAPNPNTTAAPPASSVPSAGPPPPASTTALKSGAIAKLVSNGVVGGRVAAAALVAGVFALF